jgi:hypothetical protein
MPNFPGQSCALPEKQRAALLLAVQAEKRTAETRARIKPSE